MALRGIPRREVVKRAARRACLPRVEGLESRQLLALSIAEFPTQLVGGQPTSITTGSDGTLWFTLPQFNAIGSMNPTTHEVLSYVVPSSSGHPGSITTGPDGNIWFTEEPFFVDESSIGSFNPTTQTFTLTPLPSSINYPNSITAGPDGNLWFTASGSGMIGTINATTRSVATFDVPGVTNLLDITSGPDGNLWFTDYYGTVGSINPTSHDIAEYSLPFQSFTVNNGPPPGNKTGPDLSEITAGPDGNLWFTETQANRVGMINPTTHTFSQFFLPTAQSFPQSIVAGPDGNLWFTEGGLGAVASINPTTHIIATYPTPSNDPDPQGITVGADGNLWFAETLADQIGEGIIHPDDGPRIISVNRYGYHSQQTTLALTFDEALDLASAQNSANYKLVGPNRRTVAIASAAYNAANNTVTLAPASRLNVHWNYTLTVAGTAPNGVRDIYGSLLDGADSGEPGSDYRATITWRNLVIGRSIPKAAKVTHRAATAHAPAKLAAAARRHR